MGYYNKLKDQKAFPGNSIVPEMPSPQQMFHSRKPRWVDGALKDDGQEWLTRPAQTNVLHWLEEMVNPEMKYGDRRLKIYHYG